MFTSAGVWSLFAGDSRVDEGPTGYWFAIGIGVFAILAGVFDFVRGRTSASYRDRCGLVHYATIEGEQNPIQFLVRVMMSILVGTALITYGVWMLVG